MTTTPKPQRGANMASLARRDTLKKLAMAEAVASGATPAANTSQYNLHLGLLAQYRARLKEIKATISKEQIKKDEMLPELKPYVDGVLASEAGGQDDVVTTYMVWAFDAGLYDECLTVAQYAVEHDLVLPAQFSRDLSEWLVEEFADRTISAHNDGDELDSHPFTVWSMCKHLDMGDITAAKIHKAMGLIVMVERPEHALVSFKQADKLWKRAGVKKLIQSIEKDHPDLKEKPAAPEQAEAE